MIDFTSRPESYRHWKVSIDGPVATVAMDVSEDGGLAPGYTLKLNSYDLGVDIELYDITQRLRFEHPEVGAVVLASAKENLFCAGANITMLGLSSHAHKVNFCKFTNETRIAMEDASRNSGQTYLCAVNGTAAGGGYELAMATEFIILVDDGKSAVSMPEVPLLAVLPGTGGLTRIVDKRKVRRDHADFFCTVTEGVRGKRALEWNLVDELAPLSKMEVQVRHRALEFAKNTDRPGDAKGIELPPLSREFTDSEITYSTLSVALDHEVRTATLTVRGPSRPVPASLDAIHAAGAGFWPLALARDLDDAILHLRANETDLGTWILRTEGDGELVAGADAALLEHSGDWLVREITLYLKRVLKRLDVTSRSLITLVEPGSCFTGTLLELLLAADRSYMLDGTIEGDNRPPAMIRLTDMNFGPLPMPNGLSRVESRFLGKTEHLAAVQAEEGNDLDALAAEDLGLVTFAPDDIDWEDEVRIATEERASFSPDALTGMEASLRFGGPETLETKIFGRLTAWQNWIFQRPNAVGEDGALKLFGSGKRPSFDVNRV